MTPLPILYSFRRCPYAMRARMALLISGVACELREVVLRDKPAEMIAASPKATVPVLVPPNGGAIDESLEIMLWALDQRDPEGWLACDAEETDARIAANDGAFKHHLDRYKYPNRHDSDPAEHRREGLSILREYDAALALRTNLFREDRALADIAIMPFVRQFAHTDRDWFDSQPLPHLQRWLAAHLQSDLFAKAMIKRPQWNAGDPAWVFAADRMAA